MTKTLLLMRHAKSSWDDAQMSDHARPLNARGRKAAPRMAQLIEEVAIRPDQILTSNATRARETTDLLLENLGAEVETSEIDELYLAAPNAILALVASHASPEANAVMVVAHNPGLEELVSGYSSGRGAESMPTAALARIEFDIDAWVELTPGTGGRCSDIWRPRDLC